MSARTKNGHVIVDVDDGTYCTDRHANEWSSDIGDAHVFELGQSLAFHPPLSFWEDKLSVPVLVTTEITRTDVS